MHSNGMMHLEVLDAPVYIVPHVATYVVYFAQHAPMSIASRGWCKYLALYASSPTHSVCFVLRLALLAFYTLGTLYHQCNLLVHVARSALSLMSREH